MKTEELIRLLCQDDRELVEFKGKAFLVAKNRKNVTWTDYRDEVPITRVEARRMRSTPAWSIVKLERRTWIEAFLNQPQPKQRAIAFAQQEPELDDATEL